MLWTLTSMTALTALTAPRTSKPQKDKGAEKNEVKQVAAEVRNPKKAKKVTDIHHPFINTNGVLRVGSSQNKVSKHSVIIIEITLTAKF